MPPCSDLRQGARRALQCSGRRPVCDIGTSARRRGRDDSSEHGPLEPGAGGIRRWVQGDVRLLPKSVRSPAEVIRQLTSAREQVSRDLWDTFHRYRPRPAQCRRRSGGARPLSPPTGPGLRCRVMPQWVIGDPGSPAETNAQLTRAQWRRIAGRGRLVIRRQVLPWNGNRSVMSVTPRGPRAAGRAQRYCASGGASGAAWSALKSLMQPPNQETTIQLPFRYRPFVIRRGLLARLH